MFNVSFKNLAEAMKMNNLNEIEMCAHLKRYFENQNYRSNYNKNKTELAKALANDPVVKQRMQELKAKAK